MREHLTKSSQTEQVPLPPFPVVGIGASSGGLNALLGLLDHLPADNGMAFIVVLHVLPKDDDSAVAILTRGTSMPVIQLSGPVVIEPNHVYLVPSRHDLRMDATSLQPVPPRSQPAPNTSVDQFFRSLGDAFQGRAIGVVLSGTGTDGAVGLTRIRERGGVAIAQAPEDADHSGMPRASIASGSVDFVLPVIDIPGRLINLWQNAQRIRLPDSESALQSAPSPEPEAAANAGKAAAATAIAIEPGTAPGGDDGQAGSADADAPASVRPRPGQETSSLGAREEDALNSIMEILRTRTHHDFRHYKRATVLRRIGRRLHVNGLPDLASYAAYLRDHTQESTALLQDMLISVTSFFRDPAAMHSLEHNVLPTLLKNRGRDDPVRVWVVGCATGEEAYSVSILLHELAAGIAEAPPIQIFATDIDDRSIAIGRNGLYPGAIANDVSPARLLEFFTAEDDNYRVSKTIRESVLFASHNILHDAPFSRLDLILCRNLLIYLQRQAQSSIINIFRYALKPGGSLFLGTSETVGSLPGAFTAIDAKNQIYVANPHPVEQDATSAVGTVGATSRMAPVGIQIAASEHMPQVDAATLAEARLAAVPAQTRAIDLHHRLVVESAPPSVLVDGEMTILHMSPGAGRFMVHGAGSPSSALMANVHPDLRLELRAALMSATESTSRIHVRRIPVNWRQGSLHEQGMVELRVFPRRDAGTGACYNLVTFEASEAPALAPGTDRGPGNDPAAVADLAADNTRLKEQLEKAIARFDTSNEELRASNRELASINDALRTASEELNSKKEELQSMNEELTAVNHELKSKVDETGQIQDDLQNLSAAGGIVAVFVDRAMKVKRFTPAAAELFGLSTSGPALSLADIADQLEHACLPDDAAESFRTLQPIEREVHGNDGRAYLARTQPYRTMRDTIDGAVVNLTDVTALRQVEERLQNTLEILRLAADSSDGHAVLTLDQQGCINVWEADAKRLFGYEGPEVLGQSIDVLSDPEERARGIPEQMLRVARERGRSEGDRIYRRKDGSGFPGRCIITALHGDPQKGFVESIDDLSVVLQAQAAQAQLVNREQTLTHELHALRRTQDELLEALSDVLKRPLNLIQVNADMLMRLPETRNIPVVSKVSESVRKAVASQSFVIEGLRDLALARSGKLTLQMQTVALRDLVEGVARSMKDQAGAKSLVLDFQADDDALTAICDPARIEQIVRNLVGNAIKFTDHGRISVSLARDGDFARLSVADTGRGIAQNCLDAVFDTFDRPSAIDLRRPGRGLGIGLALVQELAAAHDGRVLAESEGSQRGATFSVWLRLAQTQTEPAASVPEQHNPLRGLQIVLVDDSIDLLTSFGALLGLEGATVDSFDNAQAALQRLQQGPADLLISDLGMPGMDGYELIAEVRKHPELATLPAIALTGYGRTRDPGHAVRSGFNAHTTKPATVEELKNIVSLLTSL